MRVRTSRVGNLTGRLILFLAAFFFCAAAALCDEVQEPAPAGRTTSAVFQTFGDRVLQIKIVEKTSGEKSSLGSGFFADTEGNIITNFHVVSDFVQYPDRYRIEATTRKGEAFPAELRTFDVVHDLAVLHGERKPAEIIDPSQFVPYRNLIKGERLYSLGNPQDLGFTIVEGTFNGRVEKSLYEKIHFTGSINPGMSGGPSITGEGKLVGVNVATSGNQMSFLVPASYVAALLQKIANEPPGLGVVRSQLLENQNRHVEKLLSTSFERIPLGNYTVPTRADAAFRCWSSREEQAVLRYATLLHSCSTEDRLYLSREFSTGLIQIRHILFEGRGLNRFQSYDVLQKWFNHYDTPYFSPEKDLTNFECESGFVDQQGVELRVVYCLRAYKRYEGLYDLVLLGASLNESTAGMLSEFTVLGINFENAQKLSQRFLEQYAWNGN
jgi:S1-C subfamily serine protease